ncbi:MAG TPA: hypothetical protein VHW01_04845 [Polyangiaceae bacterium]|jgi:hypothetical protein|nr:hypothetical protein [Polyangiaceae bacterium]
MADRKETKPLKDLPGFAEAAEHILYHSHDSLKLAALVLVGNLVVPGISRITMVAAIDCLAMGVSMELSAGRRRLRLVPPPRLAANDCEAP